MRNGTIDAKTAAERLGVSLQTLYSYVSRGLLRSQALPGTRKKSYLLQDVKALQARKLARQRPTEGARRNLSMDGLPILESSLTLIDKGSVYYRGEDVLKLSRTASIEQVSELLWSGSVAATKLPQPPGSLRKLMQQLDFVAAAVCYLSFLNHADPMAEITSRHKIQATGLAILRALTQTATGEFPQVGGTAEALARAWRLPECNAAQLSAALVLCADHELNVSAFAARTIASSGVSPYHAISGALGALSGPLHGGGATRAWEMLARREEPARTIARETQEHGLLPGFGHRLYPDGDPRGRELLALCPAGRAKRHASKVADTVQRLGGEPPNLDFGLASLCLGLGLNARAPMILFAIGRSVGWMAHCMEQYEVEGLIRPRARYVGPRPG